MGATHHYSSTEPELLVVQEAARLITHGSDTGGSIYGILHLLSQLLGLNRGRVLLSEGESPDLVIRYAYGLTAKERERGRYAIGEGITGRVFHTGQMALIQDIDDEPTYLRRAVDRATLPDETVAYIAVPILWEDKPVGVLAVHRLRKRERPFRRDMALLQVIATFIGQVLRIDEMVEARTADLLSKNQMLRNKLESEGARYGILGQSPALQEAVQQALQVAATNTTVLLLGESGTGKERFARMQHMASKRADGPFVSINCAAIPANLMESELFGHEKGAFTGAASAKRGRIELASNGTLFLDEIGDLDLELQAKLLRVLEYKTIQRVGSTREIPVDVRIVSATHKDLQQAVQEKRFRLDLFYRLNVFPIKLPPLRARQEDIGILAQHLLGLANQEFGHESSFGPGAQGALAAYTWPGNIRQLENVIKRGVLMSGGRLIGRELIEDILAQEISTGVHDASHLPLPAGQARPFSPVEQLRPYARVRTEETADILEALRHQQGNKTRAAISLGLTPRQLRYRMQKLGIAN
ncbi:MAG: sigma 54-interacting transcriptional regulator [Acidihalobacter sp.]|uniref:sigma 54-interacting transcriptional regulator n=1 Tax=Acidihalobacter sp. TaxID=1872108 RepID=UPI00307E403C